MQHPSQTRDISNPRMTTGNHVGLRNLAQMNQFVSQPRINLQRHSIEIHKTHRLSIQSMFGVFPAAALKNLNSPSLPRHHRRGCPAGFHVFACVSKRARPSTKVNIYYSYPVYWEVWFHQLALPWLLCVALLCSHVPVTFARQHSLPLHCCFDQGLLKNGQVVKVANGFMGTNTRLNDVPLGL